MERIFKLMSEPYKKRDHQRIEEKNKV